MKIKIIKNITMSYYENKKNVMKNLCAISIKLELSCKAVPS